MRADLMRLKRLGRTSAVLVVAATALAGCGNSDAEPKAEHAKASPSATKASTVYRSRDFAVPLSVGVDDAVLEPKPALDSKGLLYWDSTSGVDNKVRFLVPVEVHRDASGPPVDPPAHYLRYLEGLTKRGAEFTEPEKAMVDGRAATLLTGTTPKPLDGTLGCSVAGGDPDLECFGLQPDYRLRLAVFHGSPPLVAWARTLADGPDLEFERAFEEMLGTVRFR